MYQPKISIITVCYNAGACIEETILSALSQSYSNKEIVIVDGASRDNTLALLSKYEDKIGVLVSEKDNGIYDAMNKGVKLASGDWIYFLNAGDTFFSAEVLTNIFTKAIDTNVGLIYGKIQSINEPTGINYVAGKEVILADFYTHYPINHQATFTRKKAFAEIGSYNIQYKLAADTEWFIRLFKSNRWKAQFTDTIISYYDIQGASYHKRMQGYREYLAFSGIYFPAHIHVINLIKYPIIWLKVKIIRLLTGTSIFAWYRKQKFNAQ
jgi:glycosyltransferase involved in cell wall biosynthesis